MEGRFSKKGRDMFCPMQSGYIAPRSTPFSSTIMPVEDSEWERATRFTAFISDDQSAKRWDTLSGCCRPGNLDAGAQGAIFGVPESAVGDGGMAGGG